MGASYPARGLQADGGLTTRPSHTVIMPSHPSPSTSVQAARQRLANQLKEIREEAGLSASALAKAAGWYGKARVSKIEHGVQPATEPDIRTWCTVCGRPDQVADLIASMRVAEGAYLEWRRLQRPGLKRLQESYVPLYERTRRFRSYQSNVVPGFLQTPGYAGAMLTRFAAQTGARPDVAEATAARLDRRRLLRTDRKFMFLIEEAVLRQGLGGPAVMREQLAHLIVLTTGSLPAVTLGIVPASADRPVWTLEGFMIYDDSSVHVELLTARVEITAPGEVGGYTRAFEALTRMAVFGESAAELIAAAGRQLPE